MEKLFHPTIDGSKLCQPEPDAIEMAEIILHDLGWLTQQGLFDEAVARLRWMVENNKAAFLKGCATGLTVCLRAQK